MKWSILLLTVLSFAACKQEKQKHNYNQLSIFDWLSEDENIVSIEIKGNLKHLFAAQHEEDHYHPANIRLVRSDSLQEMDIEISRRGVTRRKICDFPPIKIKFPKDTLEHKGFSRLSSYKLVTHCMEGEDELVLKEYLTYKLFNQITDKSFQVKLAKIRYIDESGQVPNEEHFGFLIEGNKELTHRLEGETLDPEKTKIATVDKEQYKNMVLFQYMIGNTDWNLSKGHNIKWIQPEHSQLPTPVPYDFDYCGLVNADYAVPHPQIPIKNVRERFLQWRGKDKSALLPVCEKFKAQKADFIKICHDFEYLDLETRADMIDFIETFFEEIEQETFL